MNSMPKMKRISVEGFRGLPGKIEIDIGEQHKKSLLIFGENGTGKSSIVDAIEFALQGRVGQRSIKRENNTLISLNNNQCNVTITFDDGSVISRQLQKLADDKYLIDRRPHPSFAVSPFVLRRSDIINFWNTPEHERQKVFFDYLRNSPERAKAFTPDEMSHLQDLNNRRIALKQERREIAHRLAAHLNLAEDEITLEPKQFNEFIRVKIYKGLSKKQRNQIRNHGKTLKVDQRALGLAKLIREKTGEIQRLETELQKINSISARLNKETLKEVLTNTAERIHEAFSQLSASASFVEKIELVHSKQTEVSLRLEVILPNGARLSPRELFSEANLDLLALLLFLAFIRESAERGQAKVLVLDDVLQSVDSSIRTRVIDYLLKEFAGWTLIVTLHDRLWFEQLRNLFRQHNHGFAEIEIVRWDIKSGPYLQTRAKDIDTALRDALKSHDVVTICSNAGLLLERICHELSFTIPISITRKRGDKYTIGDLWPPIYKQLCKVQFPSSAADIDKNVYLRNLVGAHFNDWAMNITLEQAETLGHAVLELLDSARCQHCFHWIGKNDDQRFLVCRCGKTIYLPHNR